MKVAELSVFTVSKKSSGGFEHRAGTECIRPPYVCGADNDVKDRDERRANVTRPELDCDSHLIFNSRRSESAVKTDDAELVGT